MWRVAPCSTPRFRGTGCGPRWSSWPPMQSRDRADDPDGPRDVPDPWLQHYVRLVERVAGWVAAHPLGILNTLFLLYVTLPLLAPVLMHAGATTPARLIYLVYRPACHQLPERSYFLFGPSLVYERAELPADGVADSDNLFVRRTYIGDPQHGYKTAVCQRDLAIYGSMFLMGLLFAWRRLRLPRLSWPLYLLFVLPMALDGGTQLLGWRSSNWWLRTLTGALFGIGTVWLVYPYLLPKPQTEAHPGAG
ncbi:MAG: DUF2085 domain-containing protein [Chloroflexi bacterium]|nr:MAG: DUF2085 domain-containing protein [Chloroflexota bacterium]